MASPGAKDDPELGIELEPLLQSSSPLLAKPPKPAGGEHQSPQGTVITLFWRKRSVRWSVWTGLSLVALYLLLSQSYERHPGGPRCYAGGVPKDVPQYDEGNCIDYVNWTAIDLPDSETTGLLHAHSFVQLPLDGTTQMTFMSRGNMTHGAFRITQNGASESHIAIGVQAYYRDPEKLSEARVCRLHPAEGKWGLGIFAPDVPDSDEPGYNLKVTVDVVIPGKDSNGNPLSLQNLNTYMPHHAHWLGGLVDAIYIDPDTIPNITATRDPFTLPPASTSSAPPAWTSGIRPKHPVNPPYRCVFSGK